MCLRNSLSYLLRDSVPGDAVPAIAEPLVGAAEDADWFLLWETLEKLFVLIRLKLRFVRPFTLAFLAIPGCVGLICVLLLFEAFNKLTFAVDKVLSTSAAAIEATSLLDFLQNMTLSMTGFGFLLAI